MTCSETATAGTESGLAVTGAFAGYGCAVFSHSSGGPALRCEREQIPRGSFSP